MKKYEYVRLNNPSDDQLNSMGEQGWQLVAVAHIYWFIMMREAQPAREVKKPRFPW